MVAQGTGELAASPGVPLPPARERRTPTAARTRPARRTTFELDHAVPGEHLADARDTDDPALRGVVPGMNAPYLQGRVILGDRQDLGDVGRPQLLERDVLAGLRRRGVRHTRWPSSWAEVVEGDDLVPAPRRVPVRPAHPGPAPGAAPGRSRAGCSRGPACARACSSTRHRRRSRSRTVGSRRRLERSCAGAHVEARIDREVNRHDRRSSSSKGVRHLPGARAQVEQALARHLVGERAPSPRPAGGRRVPAVLLGQEES